MEMQSTANTNCGAQQAQFWSNSSGSCANKPDLQALLVLPQVTIHCLDLGVHQTLNALQSTQAIRCAGGADCKSSSDQVPPLQHSLLLLRSSGRFLDPECAWQQGPAAQA